MSTEDRSKVGEFMFANIVLVVDDQEVTPTISALQDTGALQHSYIRQDVLEENPDLFKQIKRAHIMNTKQADGESTLEITHIITVDATIQHYDGKPMTIKGLRLLVAKKLSQCLILGAPDMVRLAPTVFMSHFMAAVTANHSLSKVMDFITDEYVNTVHTNTNPETTASATNTNSKDLGPLQQQTPTEITLLTLNVNGIRSALENGLLQFLQDNPHDILVATELKLSEKSIPGIRQALSQQYTTVEIHAGHNSSGVLIASKLDEEPVFTTGMPHVDSTVEEPRVMEIEVPIYFIENKSLRINAY